jgi:SAM-dependent methyltransferase
MRRKSRKEWADDVCRYLGISRQEAIRALGERTGHTQEDKIEFSKKYDGGHRSITLINREAENKRELTKAWTQLRYVAIRQEWAAFKRYDHIKDQIVPLIGEYVRSTSKGRSPSILDYGCGTSLLGRLLLARYPHYLLTLCDADGYHFRFALSECRKLNPATDYLVVEGDDFVPAFSNKFDFIYSWTVLEHIPNVLQVAKALADSLQEGGCLLETFGGETGKKPPDDSADSAKAWDQRNDFFYYMTANFELMEGSLPEKNEKGNRIEDQNYRVWTKRKGRSLSSL